MNTAVLRLDVTGIPQEWLNPHQAAKVCCEGDVVWSAGPTIVTLRGGTSRATGVQSILEIPAVLATRGRSTVDLAACAPALTRDNARLFTRDRHLCAYCGEVFSVGHLTREHVKPFGKGGLDTWTNVVTACRPCNSRKANRTPEGAGMPLLYLPYAPNWFEDFLLRREGRSILADQMEFLIRRLPAHSRLLQQ